MLHTASQINKYKNFVNGRFLNEGIRVTAGVVLPGIILAYFGQLATGLVLSLGALCISVTDSPGPIHHRLNGMFICNIVISIVSIVISYASGSVILLGVIIFIFGFLFSMLTVYGLRTSSVGIAALLIMVLSLQKPHTGLAIWLNALYILYGGVWYMCFSMLLYSIRPYKIIQQILGDLIIDIGAYFRIRSSFYRHDPEYDKTYQRLLQQQVSVQAQQGLLSEILFKTRTIVKESTHIGRVLVKIYIDTTELFESIMTAFQDYRILHAQFDKTGILDGIEALIISLADELNGIGLAVKSSQLSLATNDNIEKFLALKGSFEGLRVTFMNDGNVEQFVSLGRIFNNLQHLAEKINGLHYYTSYDRKIKKASADAVDQSNYAAVQDLRPMLFFNNMNLKSNIFRHSLRVAFSLLVGYILAMVFNIGHSYWILLTIVVILKPAYSLTKKRNTDRLIGTLIGVFIGAAILYFIKDKTPLLLIMIALMATCYAFLRTNYFISVLTMTPYLVIFFHMLYPQTIQIVLRDRLIDTAIGSGIAFIASIFFVPVWEHESIRLAMVKLLKASKEYYQMTAEVFINGAPLQKVPFRLARRNVLIELANVSDAFNRMLSEPKRYRKGIEGIHSFVVLSHILASHFSTLSYYLNVRQSNFRSAAFEPVIRHTLQNFSNAIHHLEKKQGIPQAADRQVLNAINEQAGFLLQKRKKELLQGQLETATKKMLVESKSVIDQFNYIYNVASDIARASEDMNK